MYRKVIIFLWMAITLASAIMVPPNTAEATLGNIATTCRIYSRWGYTVSAANHANGLIYVAISDSDGNTNDSLRNKARIIIRAIDPSAVKNGGDCSAAQYTDTLSYTTYSVLVTPTLARSDAAGNVYIGKINSGGYRLMYIPSTATKANPFAGMKTTTISGVLGGPFVSMGGLAVTNDHVLVGAATFESGKKFYGYYRVITTAQAARGDTINGGWEQLSNFPLYGTQNSALDSFAGMSNGKFFIGGSFEYTTPKFIALGGILDPTTGDITGAGGTSGRLDPMPCTRAMLGFVPYGCFYPSGQMGDDGKLYVSYGVGEAVANRRHNFVVQFNLSTNRWENLNGAPAPAPATRMTPFTGTEASGVGKYIDGDGSIYAAGTNGVRGPITLAAYENNSWSDKGFNTPISEFGKPSVLVSRFGNESRLSVFYVSLFDGDVYWTTYKGSFTGSTASCSERVRFENGATAVDSTTASGVITVANSCQATKYVARVTASAAKPTTNPTTAEFKGYSKTNPIVTATGMTANATNYIHVRLYDAANRPASEWITTKMISDTSNTIGATTTLTSSFSTPRYLDAITADGSSYAHDDYTRNLVGKFTVTGVTDLSGLASFQFAGSNERTYTAAMLNQEQTVFLQATGTANQVGTTVRLTDRAGNVEDRAMTLIYDTTPPTVASDPSLSFTPTASATDVFEGEFTISGGSVTDDLYPGGYWGVWVAVEKDTGSADDTASTLKWGTAEVTSGTFDWNLRNGLDGLVESGAYRVYVRFLDGAGNPSSTGINTVVNVTYTDSDFKVFAPYITVQR